MERMNEQKWYDEETTAKRQFPKKSRKVSIIFKIMPFSSDKK